MDLESISTNGLKAAPPPPLYGFGPLVTPVCYDRHEALRNISQDWLRNCDNSNNGP